MNKLTTQSSIDVNRYLGTSAYSNASARDDEYGFSEVDIAQSICRESFYEFVKEFWDVIISDPPVWNWHIEYLCGELQKVAENLFQRKPKLYDLVINIPPGTTKSTIISVMYPIWVWTRAPWVRSICASFAQSLSLDLSRKSRDIVQSQKFQLLFPEVQLTEDQNAKGYFINTQKGFRVATSTGSRFIGFHGHILIADDLIDPQSAESLSDLPAVNEWNTGTLLQRKVDKELTVYINVAQRLAQNDPPEDFLKKCKDKKLPVKHICLPAEKSDGVIPAELGDRYSNGLLDPIRLSKSALDQAQAILGNAAYSGQFRQHPVPKGGLIFDVSKFRYGQPPATFRKVVRYWDKAGTTDAGCYTVGFKLGVIDKKVGIDDRGKPIIMSEYWILDIQRFQLEAFSREERIKKTAKLDGVGCTVVIEQEPGSSGKDMARYTIINLSGYRVKSERPTGDKELRAEIFATQVNAGNVWIWEGKPWVSDLVEEYRYFPRGLFKDQVDAGSGAFRECNVRTMIGAMK